MHAIDVLQHPLTDSAHILDPGKEIQGFTRRHQLIEDTRLGGDFFFPYLALLVRFDDSPDDLFDSFVEQVHLGDSGAHDCRIVLAESVGIRFEVLVDTAHKEHVRFVLADGFHEPLKDVFRIARLFQGETELVKEDSQSLEPFLESGGFDQCLENGDQVAGLGLKLHAPHHFLEGGAEFAEHVRVVTLEPGAKLIHGQAGSNRFNGLAKVQVEIADAALVTPFLPLGQLAFRLVKLCYHPGIKTLGLAGLEDRFHHNILEMPA